MDLSVCLGVKAVKASINVSNVSYKSSKYLWYAIKEKSTKYTNAYIHKKFSSGLPNLGAQIRRAQNWYTYVQTDLKDPLQACKLQVCLIMCYNLLMDTKR